MAQITSTVSLIQPSFAGGEVSPTLYGRVDIAKYAVALRKCRNFIVRQYGGVENRPGTKFIAEAKYSDLACRLIPFQFNMEQTYALEFGDKYMRVYKSGGQVLNGDGGAYEISTPYSATELFDLKFTQSADVMTICHVNHPPMELQRYDHDDWAIVEVATKNGPFEDINVTESSTVYASGETGDVILTANTAIFGSEQVGKLFYLEQRAIDSIGVWETSKSISVGDLCRASNSYYRANTAGTTGTLRPSHTEGMAWDGYGGSTGIQWEYLHSGFGIARVKSVSSNGRTANAAVISRIPVDAVGADNASYKWARYAWNSKNGYPGTVVYYQQRLIFAASTAFPQTVWASRTGDYKDFGKNNPLQDDDRIAFTYAGRQVNEIRHLVDIGSLIALTSGGQFKISGNDNSVLTPSTFAFNSQGADGISNIPPITVSNIALFIQEKGSSVRDLAYSFDVDGYQGSDLTLMANHLFNRHTIKDWCFTTVPYSSAWCCRDDGLLLCMTYLRDQQVFAWSPQPSDGKFESTCSISEDSEDAAYFVVQRNINGESKRYIERLSSRLFTDDMEAFFVDCGLSYDGRNADVDMTVTLAGGAGDWNYQNEITLTITGPEIFAAGDVDSQVVIPYEDNGASMSLRLTIVSVTDGNNVTVRAERNIPPALRETPISSWSIARSSFSGLSHIEGETVNVLSDGNVEPQKVVSGGKIDLERPGSVVHVGLPIISEIETLDVNIANNETILDKKKLITTASLVVSSSRGVFAGTDADHLYEYPQREFEFYDSPVDDATGVVELHLDSSWDKNGRVYIRQTDPLPISVLAIIPRMTGGGF